MKVETTTVKLFLAQAAAENQPKEPPLAQQSWKLFSDSQRLLVEQGDSNARVQPPRNRRIYSERDLNLATEMFKKLQGGQDRRPHPKPRTEEIKLADPVDRVVDVLLEMMDL